MKVLLVAAVAFLWVAAAPASQADGVPVVRIADPQPLADILQFGRRDATLKGWPPGEILWRIDVDLPRGAKLDRVELPGYAPVNLYLADGRCFTIEMESDGERLRSAPVRAGCKAHAFRRAKPNPPPTKGMRYLGKAWDLSAWTDDRTGKTMLFLDKEPQRQPLLTTTMRVMAAGAIGSPDAPSTEVTLAGYVGDQLTLATVMLHYP